MESVETSGPEVQAFAYHGGALHVARALSPDAPKPWIDLSTGVNPHPYPLPDLATEAWTRLPDAGALLRLETAAAVRYGVESGTVVAGPGSQALIQALAWLAPAGVVAALGATYG
ncbi:MAG: threonine-phosphate decarboxylase, partial [Hyphomicrobiales bacterium]|nr:threonine-phosphate decarboxylase [Hyphomicrobiales bacterium]